MKTVAACSLAAAVVAIVGAVSPWIDFSLLGVTARIHGTDRGLHGHIALGIAIAAAVVAVGGALIGDRRNLRAAGTGLLVLLGLAGLGLMRYQARYLKVDVRRREDLSALGVFQSYLGQHTATAWGFWLDVGGFAGLVLLPGLVLLAQRAYSSRSEPPSTGITQPVRYDAAGDSANAAT